MNPDGMTVFPSEFGPKETMDRLAAAVTKRGMAILARIDHAAAAAKVGMKLRPTQVLIFGNPTAGTPLMQVVQSVGIDLPLKSLAWEDEVGKTGLAYIDPAWLAARHWCRPWNGPHSRCDDRDACDPCQRGDHSNQGVSTPCLMMLDRNRNRRSHGDRQVWPGALMAPRERALRLSPLSS